MSNVGYDLDTSGGLMPLIRALIKPPDEDANAQKTKKPQHPYYKRPGKGHNHDSCDACGEGGDLICCDRCPASFHLGCYDPPLDENDIPAGLWLCKECRAADADEKPSSSRSSRAQSPDDLKTDEKKTRSLRNKKKTSVQSDQDEKKESEKEKDRDNDKETEKELSPMEILVKAAKIMNPRQFELPREMRVPCPFPGTEKEGSKNGNGSLVTVDASGCVPIPAKTCFVCQGTCKMAPLLQCDYCPLLFHQDCLDPPLTALPTGRWMCPNHVEQYIDWKLVNSISATSRVALWDKFSGPVDQHAIKVDFIRQARKHHPMFRIKVPVGCRGRVSVPEMVRHHYRNPPPLLPSRREYVRCLNVLKTMSQSEYDSSETDEGRKHTICMNVSCPQYQGEGPCPCEKTEDVDDIDRDLKAIADSKTDLDSSDLSDSDFSYLTSSVKRRKVSQFGEIGRKRGVKVELRADGDAEALLAAVDQQLEKLDERLVKLLAWQRLQQVLAGEQCIGAWRGAPLSGRAEAAVRRSIDRARLARLGFRHVALPSELLSPAERDRIARAVWGGRGPRGGVGPGTGDTGDAGAAPHTPGQAPGTSALTPATPTLHSLSDATVKATLCAVETPARNGLGDGLGRPIPMRLSRLSVGSDSGCDVVLDTTRCMRLSPRHALIFHDEVTGHFELINYSEWGTRVNGVLYGCDLTASAGPVTAGGSGRPASGATGGAPATREPAEGDEADSTRAVARRISEPPRLNGSLSIHTTIPTSDGCICASIRPATTAAWEGSALVPHSALLQFGCLRYVFTITEPPVFPYTANVDDPAI